jgi:membrane protein YqaA with SNARE-associated domain
MDVWLDCMMRVLALPEVGLSTVFFIAFVAATLIPLGGALAWWMAFGAERAYELVTRKRPEVSALAWLRRHGAKAHLCSPGCRSSAIRSAPVAGWLELPFWPCGLYMAIGKFGRYFTMTAALLWVFPGQYTR